MLYEVITPCHDELPVIAAQAAMGEQHLFGVEIDEAERPDHPCARHALAVDVMAVGRWYGLAAQGADHMQEARKAVGIVVPLVFFAQVQNPDGQAGQEP